MKKAVINRIDYETYRFTEQLLGVNVYCYLLVGDEKALLIDTAYGFTDIPAAVREITDKPLMVVCTHGHFDHVSGSYRFEECFLSKEDEEVYRRHSQQAYIEELLNQNFGGGMMAKAFGMILKPNLNGIYSHPFPKTNPLPDSGCFDLGGRKVTIIQTPGHTGGSVSLYDAKHGYLFSGDTCGDEGMLLHFPESTSMKVFHETIRRILSMVRDGRIVRNFPSHQASPAPLKKLQNYDLLLDRMEQGDLTEEEWKKGIAGYGGIRIQFDPARIKAEIGSFPKETMQKESEMRSENPKMPSFVQKAAAKMVAGLLYHPSGIVRPSRKTVMQRTSKEVGFDIESVYQSWMKEEFSVMNGNIRIPAEFHHLPNAKGVAILAHGYGQNRYVMIPQAKLFRELGYATLFFDQRHFGESKAPSGGFGLEEAEDLCVLARWVKERCGEDAKIVSLGVSMGAMAVMNAMTLSQDISAVIEDCGPSTLDSMIEPFSIMMMKSVNPYLRESVRKTAEKCGSSLEENRPIDRVAASDLPLLVIHSDGDSLVNVRHGKDIAAASSNPLSRIRIFPGREHALSVVDADEYKQALDQFLTDVFST